MTEGTQNWILRLLAVLIAVATWATVSFIPRLEEQSEPLIEREIDATVGYQVPAQHMILNRGHQVTVRVRGRGDLIRNLRTENVDLQVPFPASPRLDGANEVVLRPSDVELPEGVEVTSVSPDVVSLLIDERQTTSLAVRAEVSGEPSAGARLGEIRVDPQRAIVEGPKRTLSRLTLISTEEISLEGHALDFQEQVELRSPDQNVRVIRPAVVTVIIEMLPPESAAPVSGTR